MIEKEDIKEKYQDKLEKKIVMTDEKLKKLKVKMNW